LKRPFHSEGVTAMVYMVTGDTTTPDNWPVVARNGVGSSSWA
jgi:hypothetical protein